MSIEQLKSKVERQRKYLAKYNGDDERDEMQALIEFMVEYIEALESEKEGLAKENEKMSDYLSSMAGDWTEE